MLHRWHLANPPLPRWYSSSKIWITTDFQACIFKIFQSIYFQVKCKCQTYKVFNLVNGNSTEHEAVSYLMGIYEKIDEKEVGLLAPLYFEKHKNLYLFSHHPQGKVWQVSSKLSTTPLRVVMDSQKDKSGKPKMSCPDSDDSVHWEWFNTTTPEGQQIYIQDDRIKVKCIDNFS